MAESTGQGPEGRAQGRAFDIRIIIGALLGIYGVIIAARRAVRARRGDRPG